MRASWGSEQEGAGLPGTGVHTWAFLAYLSTEKMLKAGVAVLVTYGSPVDAGTLGSRD